MLFKNTSSLHSHIRVTKVLRYVTRRVVASLLALILKRLIVARRLITLSLLSLRIVVFRGVFNPRVGYSTYIVLREVVRKILRKIRSTRILKVCEPCAGCGLLGLFCAGVLSKYVVLCDISVTCIRNCRVNALLCRCYENVDLVVCDSLSCFRDRCFDLVVMNPPYLPCPRDLSIELCCDTECTLLISMIRDALRTVKARGTVLFTASSLSDVARRHYVKVLTSEWTGLDHVYVCEVPIVLD